ncbi:COMM domain-containing protein 1 isoform X2 [Aotus nancymaae]|uniref:COMM domain-containing protein 1 isoform X2 n=1 Tax=Aotus nancymaae TaxID=37293 RepID=UPI0030FE8D22
MMAPQDSSLGNRARLCFERKRKRMHFCTRIGILDNNFLGAQLNQSIASADMDFNQLEAYLTAQTKKQGGITSDQAAVISKFWKSHKTKIRESLMNQSRWNSGLRGLSWRVDGKSQSRHSAQIHMPVAVIELELGKYGQESEFLCLEFDEVKVNQILKTLSEVEESITTLISQPN